MTAILKSTACAVLCAAALTVAIAPANAAPIGGLSGVSGPGLAGRSTGSSSLLEQVHYRRGFNNHRHSRYVGVHRRRNTGRNVALGIGSAIIGGIVLSEAARSEHRHANSSDWQRCANTYRSFDRSTGMYTGRYGVRYTCPYLN